jgi:four helix bundle protein
MISENPKYKDNLILKLTFEFSLEVISFTESLNNLKKFNLSNQLFRSDTSIGANVKEAQNAESKADFIHKLKIAIKEADETEYWLLLCKHSKEYPDCDELLERLTSIIKVLNKIIGTSRKLQYKSLSN